MTQELLFNRKPTLFRKLMWKLPITIHHKKKMEFIEEILPRINSVIDVGCSDGKFMNMLKHKGIKELKGIEANPHHSEFCESTFKIPIINKVVKDVKELKADLVIAVALLEHLDNPEEELIKKVDAKYFFLVFPIENSLTKVHVQSLTFKQAMDLFYKYGWKPTKINLYWNDTIKSKDLYILLEKNGH